MLGKAVIGDKTMVDALLPFSETFSKLVAEDAGAPGAWAAAALEAIRAAECTASLRH